MAFPLLTLGPGAYGPDRSAQGRPSLPPYTCNGVIDAQHFDRGNLLWDEIGDIYLGKMVLITFCSLAVAVLACLGTKPVVDPPAFVNNVRAWLLLNWLVAALWCFDRGCSWCTGGFMVDSSWNKWRQKACVAVWNAKQIVWAAAMVWICWLMKERVHALHGPQGSVGQRRQRMIVCLCRAQISFLVATTVLLLSGLLFDGSKERLVTSMQVLLVVITLCDTAVLVLAYLAFRHALHFALEEAQEAPVEQWRQEAKLVAWQARLQMAVTAVSATTSIASVACSFASHLMWAHFSGSKDPVFLLVKTGVYGLDLIANAAALLFIAGLVHCRCVDGLTGVSRHCHKPSEHTGWEAKVKELSERGFTLEALLDFYRVLGSRLMPHFDPDRHSTADVVREAIIPATASTPFGPCALATVLMNGAPTPAQRMVTHAWSGKFADLVAGVVGDALGCPTYDALLPRLRPAGLGSLKEELRRGRRLQTRYWICAVSVNQHAGICGSPCRQCTPCGCDHPKFWNDTPPLRADGEGIACEMNKFDDMMSLQAWREPLFRQVVVVDQAFDLFTRAWCVAEIHQAHTAGMQQVLVLSTRSSLEAHRSTLEGLRVEAMKASREEDRLMILARIGDTTLFNQSLRWLVLDGGAGLVAGWRDAVSVATALGRIATRRAGAA